MADARHSDGNRVTNSTEREDEGLVRAIGTGALGVGIINNVVGGGIFVLPGLVAAQLGSAALLAYLVCSVAVGLVFLCYAEIGSRTVCSGGSYAYVEDAFGPFAGFVASTLLWLGWSVLSDAAITIAMTETMGIAFPLLTEPVPRALFIIALLAFLAGVNIRGVRSGVRLYVVNTMAKLVPLMLLLIVGVFAIRADHLTLGAWPPIASVGTASVILFFAFAGAETALSASGEIRNPSRTIPRGLLVGLTGILAIYVGLQTVAQGVLGPELANNTEAPLAATAAVVFGGWGSKDAPRRRRNLDLRHVERRYLVHSAGALRCGAGQQPAAFPCPGASDVSNAVCIDHCLRHDHRRVCLERHVQAAGGCCIRIDPDGLRRRLPGRAARADSGMVCRRLAS